MNYYKNKIITILFEQKLRTIAILIPLILISNCSNQHQVKTNKQMPEIILWAWERPEDLSFIDINKHGVAFLAQTLNLEKGDVNFRPRRQKLDVPPKTYLIAVTRIETGKTPANRPTLSDEQKKKSINLIKNSLKLPNVKAIQIDFDVVVSERNFYESLINDLRKDLPKDFPLSITSLASWCVGDRWFSNFPIDEAVPMAFQMGSDDKKIRTYLSDGNDWNENLCKGSYGISIDELLKIDFKPNRRFFYFNNKAWKKSDLLKLGR